MTINLMDRRNILQVELTVEATGTSSTYLTSDEFGGVETLLFMAPDGLEGEATVEVLAGGGLDPEVAGNWRTYLVHPGEAASFLAGEALAVPVPAAPALRLGMASAQASERAFRVYGRKVRVS